MLEQHRTKRERKSQLASFPLDWGGTLSLFSNPDLGLARIRLVARHRLLIPYLSCRLLHRLLKAGHMLKNQQAAA